MDQSELDSLENLGGYKLERVSWTALRCARRRLEFTGPGITAMNYRKTPKRIAHMTLNRFSLLLLAALLPGFVHAAPATVQEANQAFRQGNNRAALEKVNGFLTANPKDAQGRFLKGLVLTELNRYPEAIKEFTSLTEDYPELPEPYNNLAVLYAAQADYERAKNSLEMAIRTHPSYATAHENLGDIYAKMASQAYDKALQLDKSNTSALTKLSLIRDLFSPTPRAQEPSKVVESEQVPTPSTPADEETGTRQEDASDQVANPSVATIDPKAQIERTVRAWAEAWSARDADAYLAFYSRQFKTPRGREFSAWAEERKTRVTRPEFIKVSFDQLQITLKGNTAQASFIQQYESNIVKDSGRKTLTLAREGTAWKIVEER
jgi:tetratricopeptide (TPR) repeat protein